MTRYQQRAGKGSSKARTQTRRSASSSNGNASAQDRTAQGTAQGTAQDRTAALRDTIETTVKALAEELSHGASDRLRALLDFSRHFSQYSFGNQILIAAQCPGATGVAGYKTWERMGYQVAKGSKAIWILAPRPYSREEQKDDGEGGRETVIKNGTYFVGVPVFDVCHLTPESLAAKPLPVFFADAGDDVTAHALCERAQAAIRGEGIRVVESRRLPGTVQGTSSGGTITLRAGLSDRNRLQVIAHEWAHELLHHDPATRGQTTRAQRECHAEATSYVVCAHFGLHNDLSSDYLTTWGTTPAELMAELAMVQRAAAHIIAALEETDAAARAA